jgi:hypothetical protein
MFCHTRQFSSSFSMAGAWLLAVALACTVVHVAPFALPRAATAIVAPSRCCSRHSSSRLHSSTATAAAAAALASSELDQHIAIDDQYPGLTYLHRNPDVILLDDFLSQDECASIIDRAKHKGLRQAAAHTRASQV